MNALEIIGSIAIIITTVLIALTVLAYTARPPKDGVVQKRRKP
jgi:hypothetical protein